MIRRPLARAYFALSRWTLWTEPLEPLESDGAGILLGAPHTSNWDFVLMLAIAGQADVNVRWFGKHTLFKRPFGPLMRALGGIPVDRSDPSRVVADILARIEGGERFYLVVTPDGTRGRSQYWKSGFYRLARAADLPVTLGFVDRTTMTTGLGPTIRLTGEVAADMDRIRDFYADKSGFRPEGRTEPRLREEDEPA